MANIKIEFFSKSLSRTVSFNMFIPNDLNLDDSAKNEYQKRKTKALFLLHGYTGSSESWGLEDNARKYNFALVMPSGENAFFLDGLSTGHKYCTYVGKELIEYIRSTFGLCENADETYVCGLSMGGFGALHTGLAFPENFGKIGAMSSALIVHDIAGMKPGEDNGVANYDYYRECFGDLDIVEESEANPEVLVKKLKSENKMIPQIYMCCGTEDSLLEKNRSLHKFLEGEKVKHEYYESKGEHNMVFWKEYLDKIIKWMFE